MNLCHHSIPAVRYHLFSNGFDEGYKVWTFHGENPERGPNKFVLPDFDHTKDMLDDAFFTDVEEEPDSLKTLLEEWIKWSGTCMKKSRMEENRSWNLFCEPECNL
uniref:Transposase-associated domain-containing protein n=1 Tax=Lactuca sativa TaxID=4236 RepID=A0A9R1XFE6_LACSA|nr:hypothetical protein LSAT_V11C400163950 [Lactuca sativa]